MTGAIYMLGGTKASAAQAARTGSGSMDKKIAARKAKAKATMERPDVKAIRDAAFAKQAMTSPAQVAPAPTQEPWLSRRVLGPIPGAGVVVGGAVGVFGVLLYFLRREL